MGFIPPLPRDCVLGLSYNGLHDSAIAITGPEGVPLYACALERLSRLKQDGRRPDPLWEGLDWSRIACVAVAGDEDLHAPLLVSLVASLPVPVRYIPHQTCHAYAAVGLSGFSDSLILTYDNGFEPAAHFGGLFSVQGGGALQTHALFAAAERPQIGVLYTGVCGLLGMIPGRHEGKVTGLAAYGTPSAGCRDLFEKWMRDSTLVNLCAWRDRYDPEKQASLVSNAALCEALQKELASFSREDVAATLQAMAEDHVLEILTDAKSQGWQSPNICLAGGLFTNVKINQRVKESGFSNIFIAPPMTDDGTALGAALSVCVTARGAWPQPPDSMALGPSFDADDVVAALTVRGLPAQSLVRPAEEVARLLAMGKSVALFSGRMEFGPRALGQRSILAPADQVAINQTLNQRLSRTDFMPFAPVSRFADKDLCYLDMDGCERAAEYMTITVPCTALMKEKCPAVVHVDNTARPQLVRPEKSPFLHDVLTHYVQQSGRPALINTSFNIHEEPIVCTPAQAIDSFLKAGLDYLYFDVGPGFLVS